MLDFRRLHVLHTVAEAGSMTKAAEILAFTPSAVSQQISALERQAGTPLVIRLRRGIQLTEAGRLLADHTSALLDRLDTAQRELDDLVHLRAGRLRMATFPTASARLLPEAIATFRRMHPEVELTLRSHPSDHSIELLRSGSVDLAVVFTYAFADVIDLHDLHAVPLLRDVMHVVLPADHRLANEPTVNAEELRGESWIQNHDPLCSRMLTHICGLAGFTPRVVFDSDDFTTVSRLVEAGLGMAVVPHMASDQMTSGVVLKPLRPQFSRQIYAVTAEKANPATLGMLGILARTHQASSSWREPVALSG
ncbi:LysR family transcriptional regulator [Streptomyces pinistramenti]|uniref:LysR family transcriptional regulator n=1 Tax=Streptomyces pinistramenti TaxID=2884812 RepID=UPI001D076419|nr:LysR family transcriptional regulator [Streptomyces pinistramenti]MCB5908052.1 LysR family transcriptional regulator [Streptomyces pinistramenti]